MKSWFSITNKSEALAEIQIYEEIGLYGVSAKDFIDQLKAVGPRKILLRINSPGGSIFDGLAIYNQLLDHPPGVEVRIDGLAASMASVIAMAGAPVRIAENALVMIHNPNGVAAGDSETMRSLADLLDKLRGSIITAYERKTGLSSTKLTAMMEAETWLTAEEAKDLRFVDEVTPPLKVAATFDTKKFRNAPRSNPMNILRTAIFTALALVEPPDQPLTDEQIIQKLTAHGVIPNLTAERDKLRGEVARLTEQFNAATQTAKDAQAKVTELTAQLGTVTTERDVAKGSLQTANDNVSRLEALCGLRGIDHKNAVTTQPGNGSPGAVLTEAQFQAKLDSAKSPADRAKVLAELEAAHKAGSLK